MSSIEDIRDFTSFKWATVTGLNPTAIRLDGDTAPLALIPDSLVDPKTLKIGNRVRVEMSLRKVVIHGVANGSSFIVSQGFLTLSTGWQTDSQAAEYDVVGGMGSLNGRVKSISGSGGDSIGFLPLGARPRQQRVETVSNGTVWYDLIVNTNGDISMFGRGTTVRTDIRLATVAPWPVVPA